MESREAPQDQAELTDEQKTWFDHMTGYLKWKVIGPDIHNPYKAPFALNILQRMITQRDFLNQHIQIRCMCDGYEVMIITNPLCPRISSNHPCISQMDRGEIVEYIRRAGLDEFVDTEIDKIHQEIEDYLKSREKEAGSTKDASGASKKSTTKRLKDDSSGTSSKNYRIVKR